MSNLGPENFNGSPVTCLDVSGCSLCLQLDDNSGLGLVVGLDWPKLLRIVS